VERLLSRITGSPLASHIPAEQEHQQAQEKPYSFCTHDRPIRLQRNFVVRKHFTDSHVWDNGKTPDRRLKQARLLTRPTLADISPAHPQSAKTASSPWDALCPKQGRSERRGEEVRTALRVGRSPFESILANGKFPPVIPTSENLSSVR
jgi:hypothetical protein